MNEEEKKSLIEDLSREYGKLFVTTDVTITDEALGDDNAHTMQFDVWDGFAYCYDYEGHEYCIYFPQKKLINMSTTMQQKIREKCGLANGEIIDPTHVMQTYNFKLVLVK